MRPTTQKPSLNSFLRVTGQVNSTAATPRPLLSSSSRAAPQSLNSVLSSRAAPQSLNSVLSSSRAAPQSSNSVLSSERTDVPVPDHIQYMRTQQVAERQTLPTLMSSLLSTQRPIVRETEISPIQRLMADIDGVNLLKPMLERPPTSPLTFVNTLPSTDGELHKYENNYIESVLQFIFTNKMWSQFFTIKIDQIRPASAMIFLQNTMQQSQNRLTEMQIHLFILIIKYIFTLYSSSTTIAPSTRLDCVITWTPLAVDGYRILRRHFMILIRSRGILARNFQELLSTILDCIPIQLKPSVSVAGDITQFITLPLLTPRDSLQNFLTTSIVETGGALDVGEKCFIVLYDDAQIIPNIDIRQGFGVLDDYIPDYIPPPPPSPPSLIPQFLRRPPPLPPHTGVSHCPGTVTLHNGEVYRKLAQIHTGEGGGDKNYSAEIASPSSENGEVMFVTNETAVVTRQNQTRGECQPVLQDIFVTQRPLTRLVVMYQKTIVNPPTNPERIMSRLQPIAQYVTPNNTAYAAVAAGVKNLWDSITLHRPV